MAEALAYQAAFGFSVVYSLDRSRVDIAAEKPNLNEYLYSWLDILIGQGHSIKAAVDQTDNSKIPSTKYKPMFALGQVVATPGALNAMSELNIAPASLIDRHVTCDWGDLGAADRQANSDAIDSGMRIFSSYKISAAMKIWIITEADRSSTTLLLPDEY